MRLPQLLDDADDHGAIDVLSRYYARGVYAGQAPFTGASFDAWDSSGTRAADSNRFTADDVIAVSLLSVSVPAAAAIELLDARADEFTKLLVDVGDDRDLVDERDPWADDWPGWLLWKALVSLRGVGPTTASKLFARKRPRLRPIYDSVVAEVTGSNKIWEPLRAELVSRPELHDRLIRLRGEVGLSSDVSPLRIFDVVAWMEGKLATAALGDRSLN